MSWWIVQAGMVSWIQLWACFRTGIWCGGKIVASRTRSILGCVLLLVVALRSLGSGPCLNEEGRGIYEACPHGFWTLGSHWSQSRVTCSRSLGTYLTRKYTVLMFPSRNKGETLSRLLLHGEWSLVSQLPLQLLSETLGYRCVNQAALRKETIPQDHA